MTGFPSSDSRIVTSRRALLRGLTIAPVAVSAIASPWSGPLASLHRHYEDEPARLERTKEGRSISRFRYHNAERWMLALNTDFLAAPRQAKETLHQAGFVCQQALCAYLLDVGFADAWNAQHIKQDSEWEVQRLTRSYQDWERQGLARPLRQVNPPWGDPASFLRVASKKAAR